MKKKHRNLPKFDCVALLTGAMPGVGQDVGEAFCGSKDFSPRLWNLLPQNHGMRMPENGAMLLVGRSFVERQWVLGMSAGITVVVGGGSGTVREANATLGSGGLVFPVASTGGAAAGATFDGVEEIEQTIDRVKARQVALSSGLISEELYDAVCDQNTLPDHAIQIICNCLLKVTGPGSG